MAVRLFDTRYNRERGYYEILVSYGSEGEDWRPAATYWIQYRIPFSQQDLISYTVLDLLLMEGWLPPERKDQDGMV